MTGTSPTPALRGLWHWPLMALCRVLLLGVGVILAVGMVALHLLALVFFPLFAALDWLRPGQREQARRTMGFLLANRPFWRAPLRVIRALDAPADRG